MITFGHKHFDQATPDLAKKIRNTALKVGTALGGAGTAIVVANKLILIPLGLCFPPAIMAYAAEAIAVSVGVPTLVASIAQGFGIKPEPEPK